jgi:hypothetical protein
MIPLVPLSISVAMLIFLIWQARKEPYSIFVYIMLWFFVSVAILSTMMLVYQ